MSFLDEGDSLGDKLGFKMFRELEQNGVMDLDE
jgi:hypothetical protein